RVRHHRSTAVDEDDAVLPDVNGHITSGAENDVNVRADLNGFERRPAGHVGLVNVSSGALPGEDAVRPLTRCEHESERDQPRLHSPDARRWRRHDRGSIYHFLLFAAKLEGVCYIPRA